jgi:hypothetical protein
VLSRIRTLFAGVAAVAVASSGALGVAGTAWADPPATPEPINPMQAPGIAAIQQLSPVIQQAAMNPEKASALLTTAAAALSANANAPDDSKLVASTVNQFVADPANPGQGPDSLIPTGNVHLPGDGVPAPRGVSLPNDLNNLLPAGVSPPGTSGAGAPTAHVPAAGAEPGGEAHLPAGIDPAHAVGPVPEAAPAAAAATPAPAAAPAPDAPSVPAASPSQSPDAAPPNGFAPDSPPAQEFMYPSIGNSCLADGGNVLATAISVAGPAKIPAPGPGAAQTAYVFTAVGTPAPAADQKLPLNVTWVNLTTGRSGTAALKPQPDINPNGPTTLTAIADTGSGSIMSTIFGQVTTVDRQCQFMPTIGSTVVP